MYQGKDIETRPRKVTSTRGKDLTGQRFGRLTVQSRTDERDRNGTIVWVCLCICGNEKRVSAKLLTGGNTRSCGCYAKELKAAQGKRRRYDLTGKRFGRLVAQNITNDADSQGVVLWHCLCDCGNTAVVKSTYLNAGRNTSCGCLQPEIASGNETIKISNSRPPRSARITRQTPPWADKQAIKHFYAERPAGHDVDHIIPLSSQIVSGLHVLENLQYLPRRENARKQARFEPQIIEAR